MAPIAVLLSLLTNCVPLECRLNICVDTAQPSELACLPQEPQSHNDAQDLLLLQDYVCKLSHTQRTLEATYASLQQTELLADVINEQDCRAIRTACCCLSSLRIRGIPATSHWHSIAESIRGSFSVPASWLDRGRDLSPCAACGHGDNSSQHWAHGRSKNTEDSKALAVRTQPL